MFGRTGPLPAYLQGSFQGLGQDSTAQVWINDVMKPIADVVKEYFDSQTVQPTIKTTQASLIPNVGGVSPIFLIAGGLIAWYLFRGKKKSYSTHRRKRR